MSQTVIPFRSELCAEVVGMRQNQCVCEPHYEQGACVLASHHISSRIYYPSYICVMLEDGICCSSSAHAFDALYQNALGYLEKLQGEEIFR